MARRPAWCRECNEDTRMVEDREGNPWRCPRCHAASVGATNTRIKAKARRRQLRDLATNNGPDCPQCGERIYQTHRCRSSGFLTQLKGLT